MNKSWFIIELLLLLFVLPVRGAEAMTASPCEDDSLTLSSAYVHRIQRYQQRWNTLIPSQFIIQNAGNMGLLSMGFGWGYGYHKSWGTHLLVGFIPKNHSTRAKVTCTLKETFVPWHPELGHSGWHLEPLSCGLYVNTVFGHEFWRSQPKRYPDKYYEFLSTKFRFNIFLGQQITREIPNRHRKFVKNVTAFYEISTCDIYLRQLFMDSSIKLNDIIGLSLGVKMQIF